MAGVSALVVLGETMSALQFFACRSAMSLICLSSLPPASSTVKSVISGCSFTSAFIVVSPVTRHGLSSAALEKHRCHLPCLAYLAVSTMDGWIICSQGVFGSPCGAIRRCAICRSKSAWLKNFDCAVPPEGRCPPPCWFAAGGLLAVHAAAARLITAATRAAVSARIVISSPPSYAGTVAILVLP